jgi:hypothetical protein
MEYLDFTKENNHFFNLYDNLIFLEHPGEPLLALKILIIEEWMIRDLCLR